MGDVGLPRLLPGVNNLIASFEDINFDCSNEIKINGQVFVGLLSIKFEFV